MSYREVTAGWVAGRLLLFIGRNKEAGNAIELLFREKSAYYFLGEGKNFNYDSTEATDTINVNDLFTGENAMGQITLFMSDLGDIEEFSDNIKDLYIILDDSDSVEPASPAVDGWAKDRVDVAMSNNLVPDGLGNDYQVNITRGQFAAVAVKLYEARGGQAAPAAGGSPFSDTSDPVILQAAELGFVSGVGDGKFGPDSLVTREQMAVMLSRVYTRLGGEIPAVTGRFLPLQSPRIFAPKNSQLF